MPERPYWGRSRDGIYPRCVWCNNEIEALAVTDYSRGALACVRCERYIPDDYPRYDNYGLVGRPVLRGSGDSFRFISRLAKATQEQEGDE